MDKKSLPSAECFFASTLLDIHENVTKVHQSPTGVTPLTRQRPGSAALVTSKSTFSPDRNGCQVALLQSESWSTITGQEQKHISLNASIYVEK